MEEPGSLTTVVIEPDDVISDHTAVHPSDETMTVVVRQRVVRGRAQRGSVVQVSGFGPVGFRDGEAVISTQTWIGESASDSLILLKLARV